MAKILGIDLGTTNSAMAVIEGGQPKVLENQEGNRTTPSVAALNKSNERLAGLLAKRQSITNPENTLHSIKRLIGRKFSDAEVQSDAKWLSYKIKEASNGGVEVKMGDKWYKPEEISAIVLAKIKADAEAKLGETIEEAIITVPAYFDDSQRQATKNAGEIAGFKVRRIVNEPTAAALAYGLDKQTNEKIVVYDFGGGTFDVSVLEVGDKTVEVKSTGGDTHLGGDDFDKKLSEYLVDEYKKQEGIDIAQDTLAMQRLREAVERAKHELSVSVETEINLPYISSGEAGPKHFLMKLTRSKLEELTRELIDRSLKITKQVIEEAGFQASDINEIILVGGQTRMPAIQEAVKNEFNKEPHRNINPDEVVAMGAAIQAGILQGDVKDILLLDVNPLSLGIETLGGVFTRLIEKNTTIPTAKNQTFSTAADNQPSVEIHVLQGEREMAADNKTLARFVLDGVNPAPRGVPQIEVSFDIDANGILNVSAKDKATNKSQSVKVEASSNLSKEEVEKLKEEALQHATEDKKKKELVEARNEAETLVHLTEKSLREAGDKVPAELKDSLEKKVADVKAVKDGEDLEAIKSATAALSSEVTKIGQHMQSQATPNETPNSTPDQTPEQNTDQATDGDKQEDK